MAMPAYCEPAENPRHAPAIRYELTLPFPPSVNSIWRWVGRRVIREPTYEAWLRECDGCVLEQLGIPAYRRVIRGRYSIVLALSVDKFGKVDQDNCLKAVSDMMQRARLVENDKNAWVSKIVWSELEVIQADRAACRVAVEELR